LNGNRKYLIRTILISSAIVGGSLLNINSATAAPSPKPIVKAAPPPPPAPKPAPIPVLIAKPTPQPIPTPTSLTPPATVTQLPSFMPWTVAPTPVKTSPPVEEKKDKAESKITLSGITTLTTALYAGVVVAAVGLKYIPVITPQSMATGALISLASRIPGSVGDIATLASIVIGSVSIINVARG
jgi:hypothetical protein